KSLQQVLDNLSDTIKLKEAKIESEHLPIINGIWFQMRQVFSNLLSNSIKFSKENENPLIKIVCEDADEQEINQIGLDGDKSYHKIKLTDNGIGFPTGMETKIFEVFQRLHGKNEFEGTGIGLSIVKKILVNHGGEIIAYSTKGQGSTFVLYLPKLLSD
ncbi:sensor histidine kinase, partial [Zobellia laminariae]|uniref:sensor histidine kinase n=1 Tax=Zobellia laminariae TaxID=248906 RepID=UPI003EF2C6A6